MFVIVCLKFFIIFFLVVFFVIFGLINFMCD